MSENLPCPCHQKAGPLSAPGWHAKKGPLPILQHANGQESGNGWRPRWVDHPYRLRMESGAWIYVAEPYDLDTDAFDDIGLLTSEGWEAEARLDVARHYPGRTIAVLLWMKP